MSVSSPRSLPMERIQRLALLLAGAGIGLFILVALLLLVTRVLTTQQLFLSYLVGYQFWLSIGLGCLVILMLQHLTGGAWGLMIRRLLESSSRTLLLLAVLFVPIILGMPSLYTWIHPGAQAEHAPAGEQEAAGPPRAYLNPTAYIIRTVIYFVIWLLLAFFLNRWSAQQEGRDPIANLERQRRFRLLSGPGLVLYGATITFASVDWVMSLEPHWWSTIYPVLFATGQVLTAFAFAVAVLMLLADQPPFSAIVTPQRMRDLGSLLLAFVMFWAYMSISQFLLIWVGNLPEEIPWYLRRLRGGWQIVAVLLVLFHFTLPFLLLLSRDIKEDRKRLAVVAVGILVMRFVDIVWWIEPAYPHGGLFLFWLLDLAATATIGGIWMWVFVRQLVKMPLLPRQDPFWAEAISDG